MVLHFWLFVICAQCLVLTVMHDTRMTCRWRRCSFNLPQVAASTLGAHASWSATIDTAWHISTLQMDVTSKPASAGLASVQHKLPGFMGSQHQPFEAARAASEQDLGGAYSPQGHVTPVHQQWCTCALLSLAGS